MNVNVGQFDIEFIFACDLFLELDQVFFAFLISAKSL